MSSMRPEVFAARVVGLGLGECLPRMKARGLDTHSKFAFGSEFTPASTDTSKLMEQLLKPMAGDTEEHIPLLRLLWWESWGIATHDAKRQAEATDSDRPRRLGPQELAARRKATIDKLSGLRITKDLEVSDQLITECVGMGDRSKLLYIPWEVCTTMELEVVGQRKDETFDKKSVDLATELKVDLAIRRRGLAMDMGDILDWDEHEKLREELMTAWAATPPPRIREAHGCASEAGRRDRLYPARKGCRGYWHQASRWAETPRHSDGRSVAASRLRYSPHTIAVSLHAAGHERKEASRRNVCRGGIKSTAEEGPKGGRCGRVRPTSSAGCLVVSTPQGQR